MPKSQTIDGITHREVELLVWEKVTVVYPEYDDYKKEWVIIRWAEISFEWGWWMRWNSWEDVKFSKTSKDPYLIFHDKTKVIEKLKSIRTINWTKPQSRKFYKENRNAKCRWVSSIYWLNEGIVKVKGDNVILSWNNWHNECLYWKDFHMKDDGTPSYSVISLELL